jgi:hypothetical protein
LQILINVQQSPSISIDQFLHRGALIESNLKQKVSASFEKISGLEQQTANDRESIWTGG